MKANRKNSGKVRLGLVPAEATISTARAITFGTAKYNVNDWRKGMSYMSLIDSLERHIADFKMGVDFDHESKLPIVDHIGANVAFLQAFIAEGRTDLDDRIKGPQESLMMPEEALSIMDKIIAAKLKKQLEGVK